MGYKRLFIWVEGDDDERFFDEIIKSMFEEKYDLVKIVKYAALKPKKVSDYLKSMKAMNGDYLFVTDFNGGPCINLRKRKTLGKYRCKS